MKDKKEGRTYSMDPEERSDQLPLLEFAAFEEPRGSSLLVDLAGDVVI